jgi:hypothetical protein
VTATRRKLRTRVGVAWRKTELQTLIDRTRDLPRGLDLPAGVRMPASLTFRGATARRVRDIARFSGIGVVFDTQFRAINFSGLAERVP